MERLQEGVPFPNTNSNKTDCVRGFDDSCHISLVAKDVHNKIHIFSGTTRKVIVCCPERPKTFALQWTQAGKWQIWVAVNGGSIYRRTFKLDTDNMEAVGRNNQAIFDDLLNDSQPSFQDWGFAHQKHISPDNMCQILEKDKVLSVNKEISSILCTQDILALICTDKNEVEVQIYTIRELFSEIFGGFVLPNLILPFQHRIIPRDRLSAVLSKMCLVASEDVIGGSLSQICLPSHLFSALFGWESCIRTLSVLLLSSMDGSVFFHIVDTVSAKPVSWHFLCGVQSQVIDIFWVRVKRTLSENEKMAVELQQSLGLPVLTPSHSTLDALIVVGASGKCCLMTAMPTLTSSSTKDYFKAVTVFSLPSCVWCACYKDLTLFASSGQHISKYSLTLFREVEQNQFKVDVKYEHWHSASVTSMWLSGPEETFICETANGDLVEFDITKKADDDKPNQPSRQSSLKDLLMGIEMKQSKVNKLKCRQQKLNAFLQQLNIASRLLYFHHSQAAASNFMTPINCKISIQSQVNYFSVEYLMVIQLSNQSAVALTSDWNVAVKLVEVDSLPSLFEERASLGKETSASHTLRLLQGLQAERNVCFRIPVTYSPSCAGLSVNVSLILHIPESLQGLETSPRCLVIPLLTTVVDVFHFLHLRQPGHFLPHSVDPVHKMKQEVAELKHCNARKNESMTKQPLQSLSFTEDLRVQIPNCSSPLDILRSLLMDSQQCLEMPTRPSCVLQAPCGSSMSLSVEETAHNSAEAVIEGGYPCTLVMKSTDISLLARARLALLQRGQYFSRQQRDISLEELQKMINRIEILQQQLQGIQGQAVDDDHTSADMMKHLFALYESMRNNAV